MKYEIQNTSEGYMVLVLPEDDYLCNAAGDNCFFTLAECHKLIELDKQERA
jgi:hypothetical protein